MGKCLNCGANFVGSPERLPRPSLCSYCQRDILYGALRAIAKHEAFDANGCAMDSNEQVRKLKEIAIGALNLFDDREALRESYPALMQKVRAILLTAT